MTKTRNPLKAASTRGFTLGRSSFAKISAIEGISLSPEMEAMFREFDRNNVPAEQRREVIARTYGKVR